MENFETTQPSPEHRSMSLTGSPRRIPGIRHSVSVVLTLFVLALSSCSGGDDAPAVDTTPDAFSFTDQTNVAADRFIISNSILVSSINAAAEISVSDGEYAIDGGAYTSTTGTVSNGQMVRVRHTASPLFNTMTTTFLSISGVSDSFTSTTGPVGTGFNQARGFNEAVYSLSPATDDSGDIYVGGGFTTYNDTASKFIIRLNSDGAVDTAFAVGSGFNGIVNSISPATDGSGDVYVGGDFTSYDGTASDNIIRLDSDGTGDAAFAVGSGFNGPVRSLSPATDGSGDVYVGGSFTSYNGTASNYISRLNSDGTGDAAFAVGSGFNGPVRSLSPATDGSGDVYVGGDFTSYNGTASNYISRLNSDGTVDTAFSVGSGFNGVVFSISPATDGSGDVYVGGDFTNYNGTAINYIIRLNSDGTVDTAFAVGSGFNDTVHSLSPATDGSGDIYVGGDFTGIIRLNSDGTVDTVFSVGSGFNNRVESLSTATDGSGDVYVGGNFTSYNGTASNRFIRLNSNGTADTAFAVGSGFNGTVQSLSPATDGSGDVYVGGDFTSYNGTASNQVIRLNSNGTADTAFSVGSGFNGTVRSLSPATDGSGDVYVGGDFTTYNGTASKRFIRLNSDGTADTAFAVGDGFNNRVFSLSPATDGSGDVYVGGDFTTYNGTASNRVIRLNSNGTADTAFAVGSGFDNLIWRISPTTDDSGDVYVGGDFTSYDGTARNRIIRLNSNGTADTAFAVGSGFNGTVRSLSPATDGSGDVYVGGDFTTYNGTASNRVIRLNSNGTADTAFAVVSGINGTVRGLSPATDGSDDVYVIGSVSNGIIRLNSDGTVDTAFAVSSGFNSIVNSLSPATDGSGDVFVGGFFTSFKTTTVDRVVRLNPDGSLN